MRKDKSTVGLVTQQVSFFDVLAAARTKLSTSKTHEHKRYNAAGTVEEENQIDEGALGGE